LEFLDEQKKIIIEDFENKFILYKQTIEIKKDHNNEKELTTVIADHPECI